MKILYFSPVQIDGNNNDIKGTGNWIGCLLNAIVKYDGTHELSIAFHDKKIKKIEKTKINNFLITKIPTSGGKTNIGKLINNWTARDIYKNSLYGYLKIIEKFKPDIIQIFGLEHPFIRILGNTDIPVVIHLQGLLAPYVFKTRPRYSSRMILLSTRLSTSLKGGLFFLRQIRDKRHIKLEETIYDKCEYFFGRTDWDRLFAKAIAPNSLYCHCQEIMRNNFYGSEWDNHIKRVFKIFSTLSDSFRKNVDIVFEVTRILEKYHKKFDFEWRIAGVDEKSVIAKIMRKKGFNTPQIQLLGNLDSDHLISQMLGSHLFVFPSAIDNSPNALQEAMLIGMPVIASHAGGVSSLIDHNKTGILVPEGEPYSMAGAIIESYKNYDRAKQMGKKARKIALDRNDPEKIARSLLDTYEDIVNTKESTKKDECYN